MNLIDNGVDTRLSRTVRGGSRICPSPSPRTAPQATGKLDMSPNWSSSFSNRVPFMRFIEASDFVAERPWGALDLAEIGQATVRLHWTDQPFCWHVNDGSEVFVVLDGAVDMHYRFDGEERVEHLTPGRICCVQEGDEHVGHPVPLARILVVELKGSA